MHCAYHGRMMISLFLVLCDIITLCFGQGPYGGMPGFGPPTGFFGPFRGGLYDPPGFSAGVFGPSSPGPYMHGSGQTAGLSMGGYRPVTGSYMDTLGSYSPFGGMAGSTSMPYTGISGGERFHTPISSTALGRSTPQFSGRRLTSLGGSAGLAGGSMGRRYPGQVIGSMDRRYPSQVIGSMDRRYPGQVIGSMDRRLPDQTSGSMYRRYPGHVPGPTGTRRAFVPTRTPDRGGISPVTSSPYRMRTFYPFMYGYGSDFIGDFRDRISDVFDNRWDRIEDRFDRRRDWIDERFDRFGSRFDRIGDRIGDRFDRLNDRFDNSRARWDDRWDNFNGRFENRFDRVNDWFENRRDRFSDRFDRVSDRIDNFRDRVENSFKNTWDRRFYPFDRLSDRVENTVERFRNGFERVSDTMSSVVDGVRDTISDTFSDGWFR